MAGGELVFAALEGARVDELESLASLLGVNLPSTEQRFAGRQFQEDLWKALSYYGSHDWAYILRGLQGVDYLEIVRDVCQKLKVKAPRRVDGSAAVQQMERALLEHVFTEIWDQMSDEERRILLDTMGMQSASTKVGGAAALAVILAADAGGFLTYKLFMIVVNFVAKALLGHGLKLAVNAGLNRGLGMLLGPVGFIASGAWLLYDLGTPAFRKTVPAVLHVAMLRQLNSVRERIGVVGTGAAGKDSLMRYLFRVSPDDLKISPVPGSTAKVEPYEVPAKSPVWVFNFPGVDDIDPAVEAQIWDQVRNCTRIIYMIDAHRGVRRLDVEFFEKVKKETRGVEVVFNFCDRIAATRFGEVTAVVKKRLGLESEPVYLSLEEAEPRSPYFEAGLEELRRRLDAWMEGQGKPPMFRES